MNPGIGIDKDKIFTFCDKWKVKEMSLFGSVLTDDFRSDSDVDVLVVFDEAAKWSLLDLVDLREELAEMFGREVDVVEKRALRNPFRKHHILKNHEVIFAA